LWAIPDSEITRSKKIADKFQPYSVSQIRAQLLRELGKEYEVSGTNHYLVAHPRGQRDLWARRFEQLYGTFVNYFTVRGFQLSKPPFPLIGIVCRDHADFAKFAEASGGSADRGVLGFYSPKSNRIILFDVGKAGGQGRWEHNYSTVLHEATHQVSFNTGLCNRLSPPPLWVAEGMAMLFEAPGVFDSAKYPTRTDRINRIRFDDYRQLIAVPSNEKVAKQLPKALVLSDGLFRVAPEVAYAESWALTFYLVETRPRLYAKYLRLISSQPAFHTVSPSVRQLNFTNIFGDNWEMFVSGFERFMREL
ncbi:MAG: DUF1570 domain-containing protein, partial [Planctomycetia bacterium]